LWWGESESSSSYVPPANQPRHEPAHEWLGDDETSTSSTSYVPPANQNQPQHEFLWWGESESSSSYVPPANQPRHERFHELLTESEETSETSSSSVVTVTGTEPVQQAPSHK